MDKLFTKKNLILLLAVLLTAVLVLTLFVFRLGIADNGSLSSQLEATGFYSASARTGSGYFSDAFGVADIKLSLKTYSLAYELFKFVGKDNVVYVYFPALIYALIFIGAILLMGVVVIGGKSKWSDLICVILFALILCDSGYIMLFNTPYKEASLIVYLVAAVATYIYSRQTGKLWCSILFTLFGVLLGGVSSIGAITAIVLGICGIIFATEKRVLNAILAGIIVVCSVFNVIPKDFNAYDSFFFGVTVENPYGDNNIATPDANAEEILETFGVEKQLAERVGTSTYTTDAYLFLASSKEVGFNLSGYQYAAEGTCFDLFTTDNSSRTGFMSTANISSSWWLRSAYSTYASFFCSVSTTVSSTADIANYANAVVPAFVIG